MTIPLKPLVEINQEAIRVLSREIGLTNTLRFINQFTQGMGNYTEDRRTLFADLTVDDVIEEMKRRRAANS